MFVFIKFRTSLKISHVGLKKTRSLGQIFENPCVCSRGRIFSQKVCLDKTLNDFENRSLDQILVKLRIRYRGHIFTPKIMKLDQNICLDVLSKVFKKGSRRVKN